MPRLAQWLTGGLFGMARWMAAALLILACAAPVAAQAQEDGDSVPPRPLELLLQHRAALGLSQDQLERVDRIRERLAGANDPLVTQMMTLRSQWQAERRAQKGARDGNAARVERIRTEAQRLRDRIQENNRAAMRAVNQLLTRAQRAQLRALVERRRQESATGDSDAGPSR